MFEGKSAKEQIQIAQIDSFLKDFGFNNREVSVYLALCKTKKATPSEISKLAAIERSDVYRILDTLVEKGFAVKILEKPVQYALASPEKAFKRNLAEKRQRLSSLETQIEDSNRVILDFIGKSDSTSDASRFEVVKSRQFVFDRLNEMLSANRCKKEVLYYGTENSVSRILFYLKDTITQVPNRNIDFKILLPITARNLEDVKVLSKYTDIKHLQQVRGRITIVDRKESMLVYNASDDDNYSDDLGLWLNNEQFSEMQAEMFDAQWKLATELHSRVKELQASNPLEDLPIESAIEENASIVFTIDSKGKITYLSHNVDSNLANAIQTYINGLSKDKTTEYSFPEDQEKIRQIWHAAKQGQTGKDEFRTIQENGNILARLHG